MLQERLFEVMHQVFLQCARQQPLVIEVEDAHWLTPSPEAYLEGLVSRVAEVPLLLLLSYRPEYQPRWLQQARVVQLALSPLPLEDSAQVVRAYHRARPLSAAAVAHVLARAQGNPLFLEELTHIMADGDSASETLALPPTLQAVLSARLDRLPAETRRVLQLAAVVGLEVSYPVLQRLLDLPEDRLHTHLHTLQAHELLGLTRVLPERAYRFKHALTREAAYGMLRRRVRHAAHKQVAQVLEAVAPDTRVSQPEVLAHHYSEAGLPQQAMPYWQAAGQRALAQSAYGEGIAHLRRALTLLQSMPDTPERARDELAVLLDLGLAVGVVAGLGAPETAHIYTQAQALGHQVGSVAQQAEAVWGLSRAYYDRGALPRAQALCEHFLAQVGARTEPAILIRMHCMLAVVGHQLGELTRARTHAERGIALHALHAVAPDDHDMRRPGDFDPGAVCHIFAARALATLGYSAQAWERARTGLTLAQACANPITLVMAGFHVAILHGQERHWQEMAVQAKAAYTLAREQGSAFWIPNCAFMLGKARVMLGQAEDGLTLMTQGLAQREQLGSYAALYDNMVDLAEAYAQAGHVAQGLRLIDQAQQYAATMATGYKAAEQHRVHGELLLALHVDGSEVEAEACFQQALTVARRQQAKRWELRAALSLCRLWQHQGRQRDVSDLLTPLSAWFTEGVDLPDLQDARALLTTQSVSTASPGRDTSARLR